MSFSPLLDDSSFQEQIMHLNAQLDRFVQKDLDSIARDDLALDILCDRDTLQSILKDLAKNQKLEAATVSEVDTLDLRLFALNRKFLSISALPRWRETFDPSPNAWWWFPEVEDSKPKTALRHRDIFWRGVSIVSLLATASAASTILPIFSVGGFSLGEALASAGQVTGLAVLGRGVLTSEGTKVLKKFCNKFSIPDKWYSEAIAAFSLILGAVSMWAAQDGLPRLFNYTANQQYQLGELREARTNYNKTLSLMPSNNEASLGLGLVYESLGQLEEAGKAYQQVVEQGDPIALSRLARVRFSLLLKTDRPDKFLQNQQTAEIEALLKLALHRIDNRGLSRNEAANQRYQLYRNLGWLRWWQRNYIGAESSLKQSIKEDESFSEQQLGTGLSHCLLAQIYSEETRQAEAQIEYSICVKNSRPETLAEYEWFFQVGQGPMATCIDTSAVMRGTSRNVIQKLPLCAEGNLGSSNSVAPNPTQGVPQPLPSPSMGTTEPTLKK